MVDTKPCCGNCPFWEKPTPPRTRTGACTHGAPVPRHQDARCDRHPFVERLAAALREPGGAAAAMDLHEEWQAYLERVTEIRELLDGPKTAPSPLRDRMGLWKGGI